MEFPGQAVRKRPMSGRGNHLDGFSARLRPPSGDGDVIGWPEHEHILRAVHWVAESGWPDRTDSGEVRTVHVGVAAFPTVTEVRTRQGPALGPASLGLFCAERGVFRHTGLLHTAAQKNLRACSTQANCPKQPIFRKRCAPLIAIQSARRGRCRQPLEDHRAGPDHCNQRWH